jgi:glutamate racemase
MNNLPIGIFDSGVGGLSVLRELQALLPNERFIFFADQRNVPYGEKTNAELLNLSSRVMDFLISQKVKMVVVACNTATCNVIDELRFRYPFPIVGVVPAIKRAAELSRVDKIALIATPATASSRYVTDLINNHAPNMAVHRIGCAGLEDSVEEGDFDSNITKELLNKYVKPLKQEGIDQLVLGCTHYPFLKEKIAGILGPKVNLVDSGKAVANQVKRILVKYDLESSIKDSADQFFTNKDADEFSRVASSLLGYKIDGKYIFV